ncbi:UNVERIFIED_CONTAM: Pentatricopeptide repeat-containing protein [Sesamum latifolium]|uniref:Pentatricopeptide repeat-containing protein n=1 Tax=Sesamum latifolium TaxID=2727402 RepID=A0AAW2XPY1_9LAMI
MLFETLLCDGLRPTVDVYTALVGAYAFNDLVDKAFGIVEDMKSVDKDTFTYSILIKNCIKFHLFDTIGLILEEMSHLGIECSTVIYNILIDGYGKAKHFELMENSLTDMIQSGRCCPDIFTFNSVVGAYGGCGRINEMEKWFDEFQLMGLKPDIMTYNILIRSYGKSGLYQKMGSVMKFMKKRFFSPTIVTYDIVIDIFEKAGNIEKMDEMFLKMKHHGLKPNSITYSSLVSVYSKAGLLSKVDSILRQVENSDVVLDTPFFNSIINSYGNAGDVEKMMELLLAMEGCGCKPDNVTFATIIQACRAQGMIGVAQNLESNITHAKITSARDGTFWRSLYYEIRKRRHSSKCLVADVCRCSSCELHAPCSPAIHDSVCSCWASPPENAFFVRAPEYLKTKVKIPGGDYLLKPLGFDWTRGSTRILELLNNPKIVSGELLKRNVLKVINLLFGLSISRVKITTVLLPTSWQGNLTRRIH